MNGIEAGSREGPMRRESVDELIDPARIKERAAADGWVEFDFSAKDTLMDVAQLLGSPVSSRPRGPLSEVVLSVEASEARPKSLSRRYGMGPLPLHTDGAHHVGPPRWIVMRQVEGSQAQVPTLLARSSDLRQSGTLWRALKRTTCLVNDGRRSFLSNVVVEGVSSFMIRWDPGCMSPATASDARVIDEMTRAVTDGRVTRYRWAPGHVLVIDNWAAFHGRAGVTATTTPRALERVLVRDGFVT